MRIKVAFWSFTATKPDDVLGGVKVDPKLIGHVIWDEETNEITTNPSDHAELISAVEQPQGFVDPELNDGEGGFRVYRAENPEDRRFFVENLYRTYRGQAVQAEKPVIEEFL